MAMPARLAVKSILIMIAVTAVLADAMSAQARQMARGVVIVGARVIDGTGGPSRDVDVRIEHGRIVGIGKTVSRKGDRTVVAHGLVLAPGFIDTHSHHDEDDKGGNGFFDHPDTVSAVSQGITTIVIGQDGGSHLPLARYFTRSSAHPAAVNVASYVGHGSIRSAVLGKTDFKREATPREVMAMRALVAREMRAGALGLSTGLEYDPAIYASRGEVLSLAKVAADYHGRYISHMRSEDVALDDAIDELIEIGRQTRMPVQISHLKIAITDRWGEAGKILAKLDAARRDGVNVTADVYPYTFWEANLEVLFPKRDFSDIKAAEYALAHLTTAEGMRLSRFPADPALVGKTIAEIATSRGTSPAQTYLDLINENARQSKANSVIGTSMRDDDVASFIRWPNSNICSDGALVDGHPRGAGAFTKVLRWLVRDTHQLSFEAAIHKMTGLAADHVGLVGRGRIAIGQAADLVLFNPDTVADASTIAAPSARSTGIEEVWVNGLTVYTNNRPTGERPGHALRRGR
jgi:N-acyl-D-amino-acid deacylase